MRFEVTDKQLAQYGEWHKAHTMARHTKPDGKRKYEGAIGGRLTWCFTGTTLGQVVKVKCACGEEIDLSDYEEW